MQLNLQRMAMMSLVLAGSAVTAAVLADYIAKRPPGERISLGSGGFDAQSVEAWLRKTADSLQAGSKEMIDHLDPGHKK